jgi:hypothetical protein
LAVLWWTSHLLAAAGSARAQEAAGTGVAVEVEVYDPSRQPVPEVQPDLEAGRRGGDQRRNGRRGQRHFPVWLKAGQYTLSAVKEGFQPLTKSDLGSRSGIRPRWS